MTRFGILLSLVLVVGTTWGQTTAVISVTDSAAPGGFISYNGPPVLNDSGQIAFNGAFAAGGTGIFRADGTGLVTIARTGDTAPGGGGGTFLAFGKPLLNNVGEVLFEGDVRDAQNTPSGGGHFRGNGSGAVTQIFREGQPATDGNGNVTELTQPVLNDANQVASVVFLNNTVGGTTDTQGIYFIDGATTTQLARKNQPAPGGGTYLSFSSPTLNATGQITFTAFIDGGAPGASGDRIFHGTAGSLVELVREDQASPDGQGGFGSLDLPVINSSGAVAFSASVGSSVMESGIFVSQGSSLTKIIRAGQAAPDGNGSFSGLQPPAFNDLGQVAFPARLTGTTGGAADDTGVFRSGGGAPVQLAREGELVPGGNGRFSNFSEPVINDAGQTAFLAEITGTTGGATNGRALFLHDDTLGLVTVARRGDPLLGSTINDLAFDPNVAGRSDEGSGLNEAGQVAYRFLLLNGRSGMAIFTPDGEPAGQSPTVAIVPQPPKRVRREKLLLKGTASDDVMVTKVEVKVGGNRWLRATGTATWTFTARLKPGRNTIKVRATDDEGNVSEIQQVSVTRR